MLFFCSRFANIKYEFHPCRHQEIYISFMNKYQRSICGTLQVGHYILLFFCFFNYTELQRTSTCLMISEQSFVPVCDKEVHSGNIESVLTKEKQKFPQEFFPEVGFVYANAFVITMCWIGKHAYFDLFYILVMHAPVHFQYIFKYGKLDFQNVPQQCYRMYISKDISPTYKERFLIENRDTVFPEVIFDLCTLDACQVALVC